MRALFVCECVWNACPEMHVRSSGPKRPAGQWNRCSLLQLHSWCAAALLILFQLCACEWFVSPNGHFPFQALCPQASSLSDTRTHTYTSTHRHRISGTSQRTLLSAKYWLHRPLWANGYIFFATLILFCVIVAAVVCMCCMHLLKIKIKLTQAWPYSSQLRAKSCSGFKKTPILSVCAK